MTRDITIRLNVNYLGTMTQEDIRIWTEICQRVRYVQSQYRPRRDHHDLLYLYRNAANKDFATMRGKFDRQMQEASLRNAPEGFDNLDAA